MSKEGYLLSNGQHLFQVGHLRADVFENTKENRSAIPYCCETTLNQMQPEPSDGRSR